MTFTKPDWRVALQGGDTLERLGDLRHASASWYEVDGDHVVVLRRRHRDRRADPFAQQIDWHGRAHARPPGGERPPRRRASTVLPDARSCSAGSAASRVDIKGFVYGARRPVGDRARRPPAGRQAGPLDHVQEPRRDDGIDRASPIYHTITACRAPCNGATGVAYPLADGPVDVRLGRARLRPGSARRPRTATTW